MEKREAVLDFIKTKKSVLLLLGLAIVSSTLYAISLKQGHKMNLDYLEQYIKESQLHNHLDLKTACFIFGAYFKKYGLVWILGAIHFLWPLAIGLAFFHIFTYGFSVTAVYLSFGGQGILMSFGLFMIQGIILAVLLLDLSEGIMRKNNLFENDIQPSYYQYLLKGLVGCLIITFIEVVLTVLF